MEGAAPPEEESDVVTKMFQVFFGKPESTPAGLKRFNRDRFPEQYPATLDEWASHLPTDTSEDLTLIRPLLARTSLEKRPLKCVYMATKDGWSSDAFHNCVDKLGPGVVLARTEGGAVVGGYSPKGWVGYNESRGSVAAFLFTWPDGDTSKRPIKLRKIGGASMAVVDDPATGPRFGSDGFWVPLNPGKDGCLARCKLGPYYEVMPDGGRSIFAVGEDRNRTRLLELKVFVGVYPEGEPIPYDDALPLSLE